MKNVFGIAGRQVLIVALLAAALIFLIKLFELKFLSGQVSSKVYISVIGAAFLGLGVWFGLRFRKTETVVQVVEKDPVIRSHANELLTERETELMVLLARGLSNKEIADTLFVTENTVKKHLNNVYTKLHVTRRTQAVLKARELGIISS